MEPLTKLGLRTAVEKRLLEKAKFREQEKKNAESLIKGLVKRLRKYNGSLDELERAISTENCETQCITIPRSLDGRLQVSQRKGLPHVMYCQLFRWPDLNSHHELQAVDNCEYAFGLKKDEVCINPFHYRRIEAPALAPIMVPSYSNGDVPESLPPLDDYSSMVPANINIPSESQSTDTSESSFHGHGMSEDESQPMACASDDGDVNSTLSEDVGDIDMDLQTLEPSGQTGNLRPVCYTEQSCWCSIAYYEMQSRVGEPFHASQPSLCVDGFTDPSNSERFCLGLLTNIHRSQQVEMTRRHIETI